MEVIAMRYEWLARRISSIEYGWTFSRHGNVWQVKDIIDQIKADALKPESRDVPTLYEYVKGRPNTYMEEFESPEFMARANSASLDYPIVLLETDKGKTVIVDGNHRIVKAFHQQIPEIEAYILKEDVLNAIPHKEKKSE
jgi:hypothetical protein